MSMRDAVPGDQTTLYLCPEDHEYGWVTDPEWILDDIYDPITVKRQVWQLVSEETVVVHPRHELCGTCDGDGVTEADRPDHPDHGECPTCKGDGEHPLAGQIEVLP